MRAFGASEADIEAKREEWLAAQPEQPYVEVMPENIDAFRVFWMLRPQWEHPGEHGGRCTVPFADVDIAINRLRVKQPDDCFERVSKMLLYARNTLLERRKREIATARNNR